jgi:glycosyltransferase involved in cell wall biosynthesis
VGEHPAQSGPGVRDHGHLALGDPAARAELEGLYAAATCLVVPSRHEPTGIVFAEAASAGVAMIGSTRGGSADVIGPAGVVVDPGDDEALAAAMLDLADPARAEALGAAARERAALFTWEAVARRFLTALGLDAALGLAPAPPLPLGL